jgi:hypothetical protein
MALSIEAAMKVDEKERSRDERLAQLKSRLQSIVAARASITQSASEMGRSFKRRESDPPEIQGIESFDNSF